MPRSDQTVSGFASRAKSFQAFSRCLSQTDPAAPKRIRPNSIFSLSTLGRRIQIPTSIPRRQPVNRVVALALRPHESRKGVGGEGASQPARRIDVADVDLDGRVVLGGDETAGGRAVMEIARVSLTSGRRDEKKARRAGWR